MNNPVYKWLNKKYPQNFIIKHSLIGSAISLVSCLGFLVLYRPLGTHESRPLSYVSTMAVYCFILAISVLVMIRVLRSIKYFSDAEEWTILKECISILFILVGMGIFVYFAAFFVEEPSQRWNLSTFFNSCKYAFLIGVIPFLFFTLMNSHYFYAYSVRPENRQSSNPEDEQSEKIIQIDSKLKKEKLNFYPDQFLYATSDGNYVVFFLNRNNKVEKEVIRNSINNIEEQLSQIPSIVRTHRAFIVNIRKVYLKKGNALGYQLKLSNIDVEIPVSRQNIKAFDQQFFKFN
jgi:hypothetical protein